MKWRITDANWRVEMSKALNAFLGVAALAGFGLVAAPMAAEAQCQNCNRPVSSTKVNTTYKYNTVQRVRNVTQYKDVNRTKYIKHVNRVVNVTRVQPITRLNVVTRVHNRTVILRQTQQVAQARTLPTRTITTNRVMNINHAPTYATCCR